MRQLQNDETKYSKL